MYHFDFLPSCCDVNKERWSSENHARGLGQSVGMFENTPIAKWQSALVSKGPLFEISNLGFQRLLLSYMRLFRLDKHL